MPPDAPGGLPEPFHPAVGERGVGVCPELLRLLLRGQSLVELELTLRDDVGVEAVHDLATRHVERAGEDAERAVEADRGGRVPLLVGDRGPWDDPRGVRRVHPRRGGDLLRVAPGNRGDPVEGKLVHAPPERIESRGPAGHEVPIMETLVEDHLDPAEAHRGVGPGPQRQPEIAEFRVLGAPRVEHDELRPVLLRGPDRVVDRGPTVLAGVVPEEDDAARPRVVGIREPAVHHAVDRGRVAGAQGHPRDPLGRAEEVHEPATRPVFGLGVPLAGGDREGLRAVPVHHLAQALRDLVERLVPGHPLPAPLAPLPGAPEGMQHPVRVREPRGGVDPLHADVRAKGARIEGFDPGHPPVLDVHLHLAVDVAARAEDAFRFHDRFNPCDGSRKTMVRASPRWRGDPLPGRRASSPARGSGWHGALAPARPHEAPAWIGGRAPRRRTRARTPVRPRDILPPRCPRFRNDLIAFPSLGRNAGREGEVLRADPRERPIPKRVAWADPPYSGRDFAPREEVFEEAPRRGVVREMVGENAGRPRV